MVIGKEYKVEGWINEKQDVRWTATRNEGNQIILKDKFKNVRILNEDGGQHHKRVMEMIN